MRRALRRLLRAAARGLLFATTRVVVEGAPPAPGQAAILAANHLSHADPVLLLALLPAPPELVGLSDLRWKPVAPLFFLYGVIPVRRDRPERALLARLRALLDEGSQLLIFPEGRISRSGALEEARAGIGYLALQAGVPVVPVAIRGTEQLLTAWRRCRRPTLTVSFAPPLRFQPEPALPRRCQRQRVTGAVMRALAARLPPRYRGFYAGGVGE